MAKTGLLLMNIGTPSGCEVESVKKYLAEFLTDPDVIKVPWIVRETLIRRVLVPLRAQKSAQKYQTIWNSGSPLMLYSEKFCQKLQDKLGSSYSVKIGMRYGEPSIQSSIQQMIKEGVQKIVLVPLYPQYAQATTGSSVSRAQDVVQKLSFLGEVKITADFYHDPGFQKSWIQNIQTYKKDSEHILFSFHGLPVNHIQQNTKCLQSADCCRLAAIENRRCYRAQCFKTAEDLATGLGLTKDQWSISFQSRLGPVKWLEPYTEQTLMNLASRGIKKLAICAPSFVVDGLETLEELSIEGKKTFETHGGEQFISIPCLNDDDNWVQGFIKWIDNYLK